MRISKEQLQQRIRALSTDELTAYAKSLEDSKSGLLYQSNPVAHFEIDEAIEMAHIEIDRRKDMDEHEAKYRAEVEQINQQYHDELRAAAQRNIKGYLKAKGEL